MPTYTLKSMLEEVQKIGKTNDEIKELLDRPPGLDSVANNPKTTTSKFNYLHLFAIQVLNTYVTSPRANPDQIGKLTELFRIANDAGVPFHANVLAYPPIWGNPHIKMYYSISGTLVQRLQRGFEIPSLVPYPGSPQAQHIRMLLKVFMRYSLLQKSCLYSSKPNNSNPHAMSIKTLAGGVSVQPNVIEENFRILNTIFLEQAREQTLITAKMADKETDGKSEADADAVPTPTVDNSGEIAELKTVVATQGEQIAEQAKQIEKLLALVAAQAEKTEALQGDVTALKARPVPKAGPKAKAAMVARMQRGGALGVMLKGGLFDQKKGSNAHGRGFPGIDPNALAPLPEAGKTAAASAPGSSFTDPAMAAAALPPPILGGSQ